MTVYITTTKSSILHLILSTSVNTNTFPEAARAVNQKIFDYFHSSSLIENESLLTMI